MAEELTQLARALPGLKTSTDAADRVAYARDLWPRHHLAVRAGNVGEHRPAGIVWPTSTQEVSRIVKWAHDTGTPVVPFGAGSGVCAGVLPTEKMIVLDLKKMTRWRSLDVKARVIDVEAGQMGLPFEEGLNRKGLTLGHFPSSILCSTVGGWVAARSAGQCSGKYGKIEDMVLALECVTGTGEIVNLKHRTSGPNLLPLVVGSEGTLAVVTSVTLRLHPLPQVRAFAAFSFPTTEHGWEAMRAMFQAGLRPAVARLYDPFDAMLARRGSVKSGSHDKKRKGDTDDTPGLGASALRSMLRRPGAINELLEGSFGSKVLGGSLLIVIFEGEGDGPDRDADAARILLESMRATYEGEGPARKWLLHRYSVSYRQAPVFAAGLFSDTMEVAAPWKQLGALYEGVRKALGEHVFVMAHMSHAYPDGCCIYFSFAGTAAAKERGNETANWDERCEATYDKAWRAALAAAFEAGGTIAHHHGAGRSKAPRLSSELGDVGIDTVRALMRVFDPKGILNPGNLMPDATSPYLDDARAKQVMGEVKA
jgi:alkyldihydroxyacetonephosphate synthase